MKKIITCIAKILKVIFFYLLTAPVFIITAIAAIIVCTIAASPYALCVRITNGNNTLYRRMLNNIYKVFEIEKENEKDFDDEDEYLTIID